MQRQYYFLTIDYCFKISIKAFQGSCDGINAFSSFFPFAFCQLFIFALLGAISFASRQGLLAIDYFAEFFLTLTEVLGKC